MIEMTLGYRRLVGWIALLGLVALAYDWLTGAEYVALLRAFLGV